MRTQAGVVSYLWHSHPTQTRKVGPGMLSHDRRKGLRIVLIMGAGGARLGVHGHVALRVLAGGGTPCKRACGRARGCWVVRQLALLLHSPLHALNCCGLDAL